MAEQDVATIEVAIQKVETEINNVENQIVMIEGLPGDHPDKARLPTIRQKEADLRRGWAALREEKAAREQKEAAREQKEAAREQKEAALQQEKVLLLSKEGQGGPSGIGPSTSYKNITVVCTSDDGPDIRRYQQVTRARLQHLLDNADCDVYDPSTQGVQSFDLVHLEDNMVITTVPYTTPMITRVQNLEGFSRSVVQAGEDNGTEALANILRARCTNVKRTDISIIKARSGKSRQLDGVVLADGAAGILESKLGLSEKAVEELDDKLQFIKEEELVGDAAVLKGKKLMGFLAGTVPLGAPERARRLSKTCQQRGYGMIVTSGTSMALGNSRIPRITPPRCIPMGLSKVHM